MALPLDQEAHQYLLDHGLAVNAEYLNWAMDRIRTNPGLRPSLRKRSTEDMIAMNGGIAAPSSSFDPVAVANPNTPPSPRSNGNTGGPRATIPASTPPGVPMQKPMDAVPGNVPVYKGGGRAGYVPEDQTFIDPTTGNRVYKPYYDEKYGARDARIIQEQQQAGGMTNQAEAAPAAPSPDSKGWLESAWDWITGGEGPTVNEMRPEGPTYNESDAIAIIQGLAGGAAMGGAGGRAAAGLARPAHPYTRPPIDPGPPLGGNPLPVVPRGGGGGSTVPPGPTTPPTPKSAAPSSADDFSFGGQKAAREYRVPPKEAPAPAAPKKPTVDDMAGRMLEGPKKASPAPKSKPAPKKATQKDSTPKAEAPPKKPSSRMKDMTNKKEADAAEKARMDKYKGKLREKAAYDRSRKGK